MEISVRSPLGCWVVLAISPPFQGQGENKRKSDCKPIALIPISELCG